MSNRFENPFDQMFGATADFLVGGKLYFYLTGSSTASDTYNNPDLAPGHANANPVVLDAYGRHGAIFLDPAVTYKVVLKDADGVTIATADPVVDPAANTTAAFQVVAGNPNGQLAGNQGSLGGSSASVAWDITNNLLYVCDTTGTALTAVWVQVAANLAGAIIFSGSISPTALAADADDYAPTGFAAAHRARISASAAVNITGLAGGADGRTIELVNIGTNAITLLAENAGSTAANRFGFDWDITLQPKQAVTIDYDSTSSRWRTTAKANVEPIADPGGRLTLTSATPVMSADVATATTIYLTPRRGVYAPLWNGTTMAMAPWESELSIALDSNAGHTGYHQSGKNFDLWLVKDNKTFRLASGPAWTNDTTRATALEYKRGFSVNAAAMTTKYDATATTLAVAQDYGLFLGTVRMSADGTTKWVANPAAAAGGGDCQLLLWNAYNRVDVSAISKDSGNSWTYQTAAFRAANASNSNRISAVFGLNEDAVLATYVAATNASSGTSNGSVGVGLDSTSAASGIAGLSGSVVSNELATLIAQYAGLPGTGSHFFQALEANSVTAGSRTWYGDNGSALIQTGLTFMGRM